ncbi:MAG TPA: ABC transporter permease [Ktedonobacterales bacterium]|nr:ABC transporter permease [Ktedonobacterales bacterium]
MVATISQPVSAAVARTSRPRFGGILRGELLKISRQRATWLMLIALAGLLTLPFLVSLTAEGFKDGLQHAPVFELYRTMGRNLWALRVFAGPVLVILTARLIGMEYSGGTIRVLLARGVGRLGLLGAKLLAIAVWALGILLGGLLLDLLLTLVTIRIAAGSFDALKALNAGFWQDTWLYIVTIVISMAVTILMAAAVTVLTRSLAAGLAIGLSFFAADNIGLIFFYLASQLTGSNFWTVATGDLLGPNLNVMAQALLPGRAAAATFTFNAPLVPLTGGHTLLVTAIWTAGFIATAVLLTWKRDVTE